MMQPDLFSALAIQSNLRDFTPEELTTGAIEAAADNADADWMAAALRMVKLLCAIKTSFSTDEVWDAMEDSPERTHDPRAMGAVMRQAAKLGWVRSTGQYVKSNRPECHRRPVLIWQVVEYSSAGGGNGASPGKVMRDHPQPSKWNE